MGVEFYTCDNCGTTFPDCGGNTYHVKLVGQNGVVMNALKKMVM